MGLGAGYTAAELLELYVEQGGEIFPPLGGVKLWLRDKRHYSRRLYDREALQRVLQNKLGDRLFGESRMRLCIPAVEGTHSEVFVFKTPHHSDYKTDRFERMVNVGLATAAAPTYFRPLEHGGYTLVDGGVWANNPIMLALIEALICFDVARGQIDVLSLGCGDDRYIVSTNQARLLLGPPAVWRFDAPTFEPKRRTDDWRRSVLELVPAADRTVATHGAAIAATLLTQTAMPFVPVPVGQASSG